MDKGPWNVKIIRVPIQGGSCLDYSAASRTKNWVAASGMGPVSVTNTVWFPFITAPATLLAVVSSDHFKVT